MVIKLVEFVINPISIDTNAIINNILGTRSSLYKMSISNDQHCSFCGENKGTIPHLFYECKFVLPSLANNLQLDLIEIKNQNNTKHDVNNSWTF